MPTYLLNDPVLVDNMELFKSICLETKDILKLLAIFRKIDIDSSGQISLQELLVHLDLEHQICNFNDRVFRIFDEDNSGEIDFREFVLSLWNYCTLTKAALVIFAFDLYDSDASGSLDIREIGAMCQDIYGPSFAKNHLARNILQKIKIISALSADQQIVTVQKFAWFCEKHPGMLFPAFSFQRNLQKKFMGLKFWENMCQRRLNLGNGRCISMKLILHSHLDQETSDFIEKMRNYDAQKVDTQDLHRKSSLKIAYENTGTVTHRHKLRVASKKINSAIYLQSNIVKL